MSLPDDLAITVRFCDTYSCGRESTRTEQVPAPTGDQTTEDWFEDYVYEFTGDGHACGSTDHAVNEATVVAAPTEYADLVGQFYSWEG